MVKLLRLKILLLIIAIPAMAQNISVGASTETTIYFVGDYVKYTLEIRHDKYYVPHVPSVKDSIKTLEFIQALPVEKSEVDGKIIEYHRFIFSKYDSGKVEIPSFKIAYTKERSASKEYLAVNPLTIVVKTLPVNLQEEIKDVKDPLTLPPNWLLIIGLIILIAAILIVSYYLYRHYKRKKAGVAVTGPEVKIEPHEKALAQLKALEEKKLWQKGFIKEYHSEITEITRRYFEERFNFRALELTSSEILGCLSYFEEGKKIIDVAQDFFSNADLVKFAKFQPMPSVNEEMMKQAYRIVNETIPAAETVETEEVRDVR